MSVAQGVDPTWIAQGQFYMIHHQILDELNGDWIAAGVLHRISFKAGEDGWWTVNRDVMCEDLRLGDHALRRALKVLEERGYIVSERLGGYDARRRYRVVFAETTDDDETAESNMRKPQDRPLPNSIFEGDETADTPTSKNLEEQKQEPPYSPPDRFDHFWNCYPRKIGKGQARKAWAKAVKTTDPDLIVDAAYEFMEWVHRDNTDPQFIPYPSTWLNGERWLDERPAPALSKSESRMQAHLTHVRDLWENEGSYPQPPALEG